MEDFAVTCPLVPNVPHLRSGSCTSPRAFGLGFLQTPPRDDALALLLAFGSSYTWHRDLHPTSSVPCLARTPRITGPQQRGEAPLLWVRVHALVGRRVPTYGILYSPEVMVQTEVPPPRQEKV